MEDSTDEFEPLFDYSSIQLSEDVKKAGVATYCPVSRGVVLAVEELYPKRVTKQPLEPHERTKLVISIQYKDGLKQYLVYMDDKFERHFNMYADRHKLDVKHLVFCFDGSKISPTATPDSLGMEENDIIEVHVHSNLSR